MVPTLPSSVEYASRVADGVLERRLRSAPAVLIEGPRACGKTQAGNIANDAGIRRPPCVRQDHHSTPCRRQ